MDISSPDIIKGKGVRMAATALAGFRVRFSVGT